MSTSYSKKQHICSVQGFTFRELTEVAYFGRLILDGLGKVLRMAKSFRMCRLSCGQSCVPTFWVLADAHCGDSFVIFSFLFLDYSIIEIVHWLIAHVSVASKYTFQHITTFCFFFLFSFLFIISVLQLVHGLVLCMCPDITLMVDRV